MTHKQIDAWSAKVTGCLHSNPFFEVLQQDVTLPSGKHYTYYTLNFPRPSVGVVVRQENSFLLLHQYRFIVDEYVWAIPSGGIEEGETPEQAAARELAEETGYRARSMKHLLDCYASYGCSNQQFIIFLAEDLELASQAIDQNEVISTMWFTRDVLLSMVKTNKIVDSLSLSPLLLVLLEEDPVNSLKQP